MQSIYFFINNPSLVLAHIIQYLSLMIRIVVVALAITMALQAPTDHKMPKVPQGYPDNYTTSVYTGYLDLKTPERGAHYVFVESAKGAANNDPVTLWLNGGPGCSSLIGFIQQIGPYVIPDGANYNMDDPLTQNPHTWQKISNLLFIESPAGVGYSYNNNSTFYYSDVTTAIDNMNALLDFFNLYPEYKRNPFWLAGESYAGKYIPDLAVLIDQYNIDAKTPINFKGMMIGNGIMDFNTLSNSEVQYMIDRSFVNPEIRDIWHNSCHFDPDSAGCRYFAIKFQEDIDEINPYNVYGYCYYNDSFNGPQKRPHLTQQSILTSIKNKINNSTHRSNGPTCNYFNGMHNYFNLNELEYRAKFYPKHQWNGPCAANITYNIDPSGSMNSYRYLLGRWETANYQIHLYNGNWDVVVPYHDTIENIRRLDLLQSYIYIPWFTNDQHSGFQQLYSGLILSIVKGGSHSVPQSKRAQAFNLFQATIDGHRFVAPTV